MKKHFQEFVKNTSVYSLGTLLERAVLVFFLPLLTTYLSPEDFGVFALCSLATTLCVNLTAPFISALNRFYFNPEYFTERQTLLFTLLLAILLKTFILFGFFFCFSELIGQLISDSNHNAHPMITAFAFVLLVQPAEDYIKAFYRLEQKAVYYIVVSFLQVLIYCCSLLILLVVLDYGAIALPISIFIRILFGIILLLPKFLRFLSYRLKLSLIVMPLKYGYPLILSAYSNYILQAGDRAILKIYCSLSQIGIYHIGYQIASFINFIFVIPTKLSLHPITYKQENQPVEQKYFLRRTATIFYGSALFIGLVLSLFSREIVMLLARQESYHGAWIIVPFIVFGYIQHGLGIFLGIGLGMKKKSFLQSCIIFVSAMINILLNYFLIPRLGIIGAAISTAAAYIIWNYLKAYYSAKYYELRFEYRRFLILSFIWIVLLVIGLITSFSFLYFSVAFRFFLVLSFPIIIFVSGILYNDEKALLLNLLKINNIYRFIRMKI